MKAKCYAVYEFGSRTATYKLIYTLDKVYAYLVDKYQCKATKGSLKRALEENYGSCALYQDFRQVCIEEVDETTISWYRNFNDKVFLL